MKEKIFLQKNLIFENFFFNNKNNKMYVKNLSLLNCFDDYEETIFMDRCHTADKGYEIISEKISNFILYV